MKKKKLLIDLSALKDVYCGLGQVALNHGRYFRQNHYIEKFSFQIYLLLPKKMFGRFGNQVKYISSSNWLRQHCRYLFPKFDFWHSTHQLSRFKPAFKSTKYVLTIHDLNFLYEKTGKNYEKHLRRIKRKVNRADKIICISEFAKKDVEQNLELNGKCCEVIFNGVEQITEKHTQKPNCEIEKPFFFTIGVLLPKKNFHVLLDLMKLMPEKHLYIAGKNNTDYGKMIQQRIENENINNVSLLGVVSSEEKHWLYANCDAFVFPSLFEGFGLPVIEALQFGKPVFSSQKTSLKEIGDEHVAFWGNFEPNYMKQTVDNYLIDFQNSPEKIQAAKDYANSFSYDKNMKAYLKVYQEILK